MSAATTDDLAQLPWSTTVYSIPEYLKDWLDITLFPGARPCGRGGFATVRRLACADGKEAAVKKIRFKPDERDADGIPVDMKVINVHDSLYGTIAKFNTSSQLQRPSAGLGSQVMRMCCRSGGRSIGRTSSTWYRFTRQAVHSLDTSKKIRPQTDLPWLAHYELVSRR